LIPYFFVVGYSICEQGALELPLNYSLRNCSIAKREEHNFTIYMMMNVVIE